MRKTWGVCKCFYEKNIFVKQLGRHIEFKSDAEFLSDYRLELTGLDHNLLLEEIKHEITRRKERMKNCFERRKRIVTEYNPVHDKFFKEVNPLSEDLVKFSQMKLTRVIEDVYVTPFLEKEVCDQLVEELDHFKDTGIPFSQPNSMNRHGVLLEELGMDHLVDKVTQFVEPVARRLFPDLVGPSGLDSCRAFTVDYNHVNRGVEEAIVEPDIELGTHFDNSEVTLNLSLTTGHEEGELYFMKGASHGTAWPIQHRQGHAVLHPGRMLHGAMPVTEGRRTNLILWFRSSTVRNLLCPMCGSLPTLEEAEHGKGDGFTMDTSSSLPCLPS